jgi:tetratricopeptide (TPR) repeat protein
VGKIGRNQPCSCGSGTKYKRCCGAISAPKPAATGVRWVVVDPDGLDALSNSVRGLIKERRFDDALAACKRLLDAFPDVGDGLERSGEVHEAMGKHALAADFYRHAHAFVSDPVRRADYDEELIDHWRLKAEVQERLATEGDRASSADQERAP